MRGPCMCGDTHCPSCGVAQGNWKCPICRAWADDGCDHIGEDGELLAEYEAEARVIAETEALADQRYAEQMEEEQKMFEEWERSK